MEFKIKYKDFPLLEPYLFHLAFPCHCFVKISFFDSDEEYYYETIETFDGKLVLITIQGYSVMAAHQSLNQEPYSGNIISGEDDIGERLTANAEGTG